MASLREMDEDRQLLMMFAPDGPQYPELVTLADGTLFLRRLSGIIAFYKGGPHFEVVVEVRDGLPCVTSINTRSEPGEPPITGSVMHRLAFGTIIEQIIGASAEYALTIEARTTRGPTANPSQVELDAARESASKAQRGRPVGVGTLERVAQILKNNSYNANQEVVRALGVSSRTASRYISETKRRGLLDKSGDG